MFSCPFQYCNRTFSHCAALRKYTKTHQGQVYWEILSNISNNVENTVKNSEKENECNEDEFDVDMDANKNDTNINECDINNADEISEFSIEAEEQP
ncbi:3747_t:CDS:2, partial [Funneliformis caledonium]